MPKSIYKTFIMIIMWGGVLAGCAGQSYQQTLVAEHELLGTQINALAVTTTRESALMQITVDYANTQVALIATQSQFLKATLVGMGTDLPYLNNLQATAIQRPVTSDDMSLPEPLSLFAMPEADVQAFMMPTATEVDLGGDVIVTATPSPIPSPIITPAVALTEGALTAIAQATPIPENETNFVNALPDFVRDVRLGTSVGSDDCVGQVVSTFTKGAEAIYISARIQGSPANTRFFTRWNSPDGQGVTFDYVPDFSIRDACIWFFIAQSDLPFIAGNWSVNLGVNNESQSNTYTFNIVSN